MVVKFAISALKVVSNYTKSVVKMVFCPTHKKCKSWAGATSVESTCLVRVRLWVQFPALQKQLFFI